MNTVSFIYVDGAPYLIYKDNIVHYALPLCIIIVVRKESINRLFQLWFGAISRKVATSIVAGRGFVR